MSSSNVDLIKEWIEQNPATYFPHTMGKYKIYIT